MHGFLMSENFSVRLDALKFSPCAQWWKRCCAPSTIKLYTAAVEKGWVFDIENSYSHQIKREQVSSRIMQ